MGRQKKDQFCKKCKCRIIFNVLHCPTCGEQVKDQKKDWKEETRDILNSLIPLEEDEALKVLNNHISNLLKHQREEIVKEIEQELIKYDNDSIAVVKALKLIANLKNRRGKKL